VHLAIVSARQFQAGAKSRQTIIRLLEIHIAVSDINWLGYSAVAGRGTSIRRGVVIADLDRERDRFRLGRRWIAAGVVDVGVGMDRVSPWPGNPKVVWAGSIGCLGVQHMLVRATCTPHITDNTAVRSCSCVSIN
jgi:hypothetical protein